MEAWEETKREAKRGGDSEMVAGGDREGGNEGRGEPGSGGEVQLTPASDFLSPSEPLSLFCATRQKR
uniref:Uncharacterized protein n=1 Tax=Oryza brachyantha TaxID=4533 RepID=J3NAL9_ORYBR